MKTRRNSRSQHLLAIAVGLIMFAVPVLAQRGNPPVGQTYPSANGGPANIRMGQRDLMLQQNWVNARKGYCAMARPQQ